MLVLGDLFAEYRIAIQLTVGCSEGLLNTRICEHFGVVLADSVSRLLVPSIMGSAL